jgi:ATP phosphoribosyltransferase
MNKLRIAVPSNSNIKRDIDPILQEALSMKETRYCELNSNLENGELVRMRLTDAIRLLKAGEVDVALLSDDKTAEDIAKKRNAVSNLRRAFALDIPNPPEMSFLYRPEDEDLVREVYLGIENDLEFAFTSYPALFRNRQVSLGADDPGDKVVKLDGQVESFLRNGMFDGPALAYDLVRSGDTAKKFGLKFRTAGQVMLPGIWYMQPEFSRISDTLEELREKLGQTTKLYGYRC